MTLESYKNRFYIRRFEDDSYLRHAEEADEARGDEEDGGDETVLPPGVGVAG